MREATEMSMILEKLLAHYHCSDIFQLPTGKWKGHDADENIFQLLVGKCGGGYTGRDKPIADFFAHHKDKVDRFLGAAETLVPPSRTPQVIPPKSFPPSHPWNELRD